MLVVVCKGLGGRCVRLQYQFRNLQFVTPLLHWENHAGVSGKTWHLFRRKLFFLLSQESLKV